MVLLCYSPIASTHSHFWTIPCICGYCLFFYPWCWGWNPRALHMLDKCSTIELNPQPKLPIVLALNSGPPTC
jgi:hypothetical protein